MPATTSAISAIGCTVPISLLAHPTETRIVSAVMRLRSFSGSMRPNWSGGTLLTRKPAFSSILPMLWIEMWSTSEITTWSPARRLRFA